MPQTRSNQAQTPINSDALNLTTDLATMADSLQVIVTCANTAAGDTVAATRAAAGFPVSDSRPLFIWDQSQACVMVKLSGGWYGAGERIRQMHFRSSAFAVPGGSVLWDVGPLVVQTGDTINGGFASQNATSGYITINETGYYSIGGVHAPDGSAGNAMVSVIRTGGEVIWEASTSGYSWYISTAIPRRKLTAGETLLFRCMGTTGRNWTTDLWVYKLAN